MQLLIRGLVDPRPRRLRIGDELRRCCASDRRAPGSSAIASSARLDVRELRLDAGHRLAEEPEPFEQPDDVGADARRRAEVDDLDGDAAADAIEPPDALLDGRGLPRQVVEHEPVAELEVAPFAAGLGRDEEARPLVGAEPGDLGVAPRRRQLLVEDAARELRARAERVAQHLERLAMGDEHERLLVRPPPALRLRSAATARRGSARSIASACWRSSASSGPSTAFSAAPEASARRMRSSARRLRNGIALRSSRVRGAGPRSARGAPTPAGGRSTAIGTRGGRPPMSTRRVELVHGGSGTPDASRASTSMPSGNSSGRSSCSSRKNPCASSSSGVALSSSTCRPSAAIGATARYAGSPGCPGGRRSRCASSTTSRSMPAATAWPVSSGRCDERLERDHRAAMDVERVEAGAEVARDVGQARRVEQREHLVVLAPQLAQPLHRQRLGRDDQAALDRAACAAAGS